MEDLLLVYMIVTDIPLSQWPCMVERQGGKTLLAVDPRAGKAEVVEWCVQHLTAQEQNAYRAAYGQGPVGTPLEDWMMDGPLLVDLPSSLRVDSQEEAST